MGNMVKEELNHRVYLVARLEESEFLDEDSLAAVSGEASDKKTGIEGILPISYGQLQAERVLRYDVNSYVPYTEYKKQIRRKENLIKVFLSILDVYALAESYLLDPECFMLNEEYIYVERETGKAWLVLYPVYGGETRKISRGFLELFREMITGIRLDAGDMAFYGTLFCELNDMESFHIVAFRRFLLEMGKGGQEPAASNPPESVLEVAPGGYGSVRESEGGIGGSEPEREAGGKESERKKGMYVPDYPEGRQEPHEPKKGNGHRGLFGGLLGGKTDKKAGKKQHAGIRLPDDEELPKGFGMNEECGGKKEKQEKRTEKKQEAKKSDNKKNDNRNAKRNAEKNGEEKKERGTGAADIPRTDDELLIPPTDDDFAVPQKPGRKLFLKQSDTGMVVHASRFPFEIGRDGSGFRVDLSMEKVSRKHAVITETTEGFMVCDISKHGTFLDGRRIPKGVDIPLENGMKLLLKEVEFTVIIEEN